MDYVAQDLVCVTCTTNNSCGGGLGIGMRLGLDMGMRLALAWE